jgi:ParB-like chromosome segregation protein Spo0J
METTTKMKVERVKIADLSTDSANARKHGERNLKAIVDSLRAFGQQKPIVVDKRGIVIAGNGTLQAAQGIGWTEIDIVRTDLEGPEATAFGIADNRTSELAEWDDEVLHSLLDSLDEDLRNVLEFADSEIEAMAPSLSIDTEEDQDNQQENLKCPNCGHEWQDSR